MTKAARSALSRRIRHWRERREIARFFRQPYAARVAEIQDAYAHCTMKASFERYFAEPDRVASHPQPFYDIILAYATALRPPTIMQIGCFTALESRWLVRMGCPSHLIASDFEPDRLAYLKKRFAGTPCERIELRRIDLEHAAAADLDGIALIVGNAVLSNIQPEGLERFLEAVAASAVAALIVSDIYCRESLTRQPGRARSLPSAADRNWFHPFFALAARHGLDAVFLPDFTASSFVAARGIFVLHRGIAADIHARAAAEASQRYLARQGAIWAALEPPPAAGAQP
ncbi:MAG: hypothetical protein JO010_02365 [Alphaproteobacteria bacterium]|nr:hypothetical protein [Alphaproteobacteria bacterium]